MDVVICRSSVNLGRTSSVGVVGRCQGDQSGPFGEICQWDGSGWEQKFGENGFFRLSDLRRCSPKCDREEWSPSSSMHKKEETFQVSNDRAVGLKTQLVPFVFSFPSLPSLSLSSFFTQSLGRLGRSGGKGMG